MKKEVIIALSLLVFALLIILIIILSNFGTINLSPRYKFLRNSLSFSIGPMNNIDIINDRFLITNSGKTNITGYIVKIDNNQVDLVVQKRIPPGKKDYLYLANFFSSGNHNLTVTINGTTQMIKVNVPTDLHVNRLTNIIG